MRLVSLISLVWLSMPVFAGISLEDDAGNVVALERPARRIVSLAPHVTELLFEAGAGDAIVATVEFSDYPLAAQVIPRIGDAWRIDREALAVLRPDVVIAWASGTPPRELEAIRKLGIPLFLSEPRQLPDIAAQIREFGKLAGTREPANAAAARYEAKLESLRSRYAGKSIVPVFYQMSLRPLMTVNGDHIISAVLKLCGGANIFSRLGELAPVVSREAVLAAAPAAIVYALSTERDRTAATRFWSLPSQLPAGRKATLIAVPADYIHRPTTRILEGAAQLCDALEGVRKQAESRSQKPESRIQKPE